MGLPRWSASSDGPSFVIGYPPDPAFMSALVWRIAALYRSIRAVQDHLAFKGRLAEGEAACNTMLSMRR